MFLEILVSNRFSYINIKYIYKQAGAELCQAQYKLGLAVQEANQRYNQKLAQIKLSSMLDMPTEPIH
jgi:hypothetical protein